MERNTQSQTPLASVGEIRIEGARWSFIYANNSNPPAVCELAVGGGRPSDAALQRGYFVEPTIFYDVDNSATIAREEIFGPVMAVIPFEDEADALRIANDTPYGLAAAVWSRDIFKCLRMVKRLQAGIVWVNHMQPTYVEAPWGGYKMSGIGRELGMEGLDEYLESKRVCIDSAPTFHIR